MLIINKPAHLPIEGLAALSANVTQNDEGLRGEGDGFHWETRTHAEANGLWVDTTLTTEKPLTFNPSMIVWLGPLDNMNDRQAHTWRQTILRGPTVNQQGLGGNDLPAAYLYDHETRLATVVYFPPDAFTWAPHRFYDFSIREVTQYQPVGRYGLGLVATTADPQFTFPAGTHQFRLWYHQQKIETPPSTWEAQQALISTITPLLDQKPTLVAAPGWDKMAGETLDDLSHEACWVTLSGETGLRAYVRGSSALNRDEAKSFELMTQLDVLLPLLQWRRATGESRADGTIDRLLTAVKAYKIIEPHHYLPNHYPYQQTDTFMDTWYFYENALIKLPWVAFLTGDAGLRQTFLTALEGGLELARKTGYLLPLFADADGWKPRNSVLNVGVSGLLAAGCALAYQLTGDVSYRADAVQALNVIHQLPPHMLTHEPQQLSFAAATARWLSSQFPAQRTYWLTMARDFVNLSLRMGYWGKDPAVPFYDPRGMFQACASLSYPAYKENVEVLWAWSELLCDDKAREVLPAPLMAAFANLQRCHNYAFFDPYLPEDMRRGPCPYVPYEDLATAEFTHTATLGKELYGAGEVFWSALLFDAPNCPVDAPPDVLRLALDVPCVELPIYDPTAPMRPRRWLLYNPRDTDVQVAVRESEQTRSLSISPRSIHIYTGA